MPRKVIIDCDPGIEDVIALCMALFDPRLEVLAVTAVAGNVSGEQTTRNVQSIIEQLDPPRYPRLGAASLTETPSLVDNRPLVGEDGLGNAGLASSTLARQHPAEKLICDEVRAAPGEVTLICLGPLTNIAAAINREPQLISMLGRLVIMGGAVNGVGNVTSAAEFNIYCDPLAARQVFRSPTTKTLIPLDVTSQVTWSLDFLDQLPPESTRAGNLLRKTLPFLFRAYRRDLGLEGIYLHDAVAMAAVLHPELFTTRDLTGDVETAGELTLGATVFDRRNSAHNRGDMEVALEVDAAGVIDCVARALQDAGRQT